MLGYEKEIDIFGLEMMVDEGLMSGELPIQIIKGLSKKFDKRIIQQVIAESQEYLRKIKWCENKGHKWVDTSYGNPEHGEMSGYCKRCGYSFCTSLY